MKRSIQLLPVEPPPIVDGGETMRRHTTHSNEMMFVHCVEPEGKHSGKARKTNR